jgi:uncharacterized protein (TIRG00374 family)
MELMTNETKPEFTKGILIFVGLGLLVLVFYLYYFVGTSNIIEAIEHINVAFYISGFVAFTISILFSALTWQSLLRNLNIKIKIQKILLLTWAGLFFDATIPEPGWTGDLSKAYMLARSTNQDPGRIAASVIGQKVIIMSITVFDLFLGLALLAFDYSLSPIVLIFLILVLTITIFSSAIILYISTKPQATERLLNLLIRVMSFILRGRLDSEGFRTQAKATLNQFHEGIRALGAEPRKLAKPVFLAFLSWVFDISIVFLVYSSLGYNVPIDKVLIVYALTGSLQSIGISFIGFTETIMSYSYTVLGIPKAISLLATILLRIITLGFKMIVSYIAFQYAGFKILFQRTTSNPGTKPAYTLVQQTIARSDSAKDSRISDTSLKIRKKSLLHA